MWRWGRRRGWWPRPGWACRPCPRPAWRWPLAGSLLPDVDHPKSWVGQRLRPLVPRRSRAVRASGHHALGAGGGGLRVGTAARRRAAVDRGTAGGRRLVPPGGGPADARGPAPGLADAPDLGVAAVPLRIGDGAFGGGPVADPGRIGRARCRRRCARRGTGPGGRNGRRRSARRPGRPRSAAGRHVSGAAARRAATRDPPGAAPGHRAARSVRGRHCCRRPARQARPGRPDRGAGQRGAARRPGISKAESPSRRRPAGLACRAGPTGAGQRRYRAGWTGRGRCNGRIPHRRRPAGSG